MDDLRDKIILEYKNILHKLENGYKIDLSQLLSMIRLYNNYCDIDGANLLKTQLVW